LADFTNEVAVISEEAIDQKPAMKRRIFVASLLALAAIGTHWLPGRPIVTDQLEPQQQAVAVSDKLMTGPNSLLGVAVSDKTSQSLAASADLSQYHLDVTEVVDQAGVSRLLNDVAPSTGSVSSEWAVPGSIIAGENISLSQTSAVPEPRTAGLLLLAVAPVFIRRQGSRKVAV
jgi:hypothetical protein